MDLRVLTVGPVSCNCCILACRETGEAAILDPGGNPERILREVHAMGVKVGLLLHTHAHFDHILATGEIAAATGAAVLLPKDDLALYEDLPRQALKFGIVAKGPPRPDRLLGDGETVEIGTLRLEVLHTPGHTPGSASYLLRQPVNLLFSGDTLFANSVGRTDFPGGSFEALSRSIRSKLYVLPGETRVRPGHGPETTIGHEREHNPFVGL
jgi:glyoxylase-like metal-dependent hydrolase (beta-lactamase superfamily II)